MRVAILGAVILVVVGAGIARGNEPDLLFDNYLPNPDGGWDGRSLFTSELTAAVAGPGVEPGSWAGDDAVFASPVKVEEITWLALTDTRYSYTVQTIILDPNRNPVYESPETLPLDIVWSDPGNPVLGLTPYEGRVELPGGGINLSSGQYFFAVRLVNRKPSGQLGGGRNLMMTTSAGPGQPTNPDGMNEGIVYCPSLGINHWTSISQAGPYDTTDYAYRVYGTPEPASLLLVGLGAVLLRRR